MIQWVKDILGLDIKEDQYAYGVDATHGYMSQGKIPDRWIKTTCGYCSVGCGMDVGVKDDQIVGVRGDLDHPVNRGTLCPKGLSEHVPLTSPLRAKDPLAKDSRGQLKPLSWGDAFQRFADRVTAIQAKHGRESFAVLSTGQLVTEEFYALGKLVQLGFGTPHYDGNTTLCMSSAVVGYKQSFGSDGPPGSYRGLAKADVIFLIGANIADNHPILWHHINENPSKQIIVCDPRKSKTAMFADLYLPIRPRRDIDLLNGLIHLVIANGHTDDVFIRDHTEGFEALRAHVEPYSPSETARRTGLSETQIRETAEAIGTARNCFFAWTMGINQSTQGSDTASMINTLALITGNIGRTGAAPMSITGQCNAMGSREFSFSSSLPGYRKFEDPLDRAELAALWNVSVDSIPAQRGNNYPQIIDGIIEGRIKALWIVGTNPLVSFPDQNRLRLALKKLEFIAVQDGFHPTPTTELADLLLPAAIWGEKEGCYTNSERRVSGVRAAVSPPGQAKPDFDIFMGLAQQLGCRDALFPGWADPRDSFAEMQRVSKGRLCDYSGIRAEQLRRGGVQWPCNETRPEGTDSLYEDGVFQTPSGRARLLFTERKALEEETSSSYRLILNTGRTVEHWHTGTKTTQVPILDKLAPCAWVEINPQTAKYFGIRPKDKVALISARGRIDDLLVRITETIAPEQVFMPFHFAEQCTNLLTLPVFDPKSGQPNYKQCAVRIQPMPKRY